MSNYIEITSIEQFNEYYNSDKCLVLDFTATWCGPCRMIAPLFKLLSDKYTDIYFLKIDVDENDDISSERNISCMPTFEFVKDKKTLHTIQGANTDAIVNSCEVFYQKYVNNTKNEKVDDEDTNNKEYDKQNETENKN